MGALSRGRARARAGRRLRGRRSGRGLPASSSASRAGARGRGRGSTSSTTAAWAGSATPTRGGAGAARACAADPSLELAGVWTHFATADEPRVRLLRRAARALRARSPSAVKAEFPGVIAPRRQQRRDVFREPALPLRHGPLRSRGLRARSVPGRPGRARPGAGALAALLRRRRQALPGRRQRRLRPDLERAGGDLGRRAADRLRRRGAPRRSPTTPRCSSAAAATRWSARSRWTTSRSTSAPETEVEPGDEAVLIGAQGEEAILAEEVAARLGTINYEVTCGISARVPRRAVSAR